MSDIQFDLFIQEKSLKKTSAIANFASIGRSKIHRNDINDSLNCHLIIWQKIIFCHKKTFSFHYAKIKLVLSARHCFRSHGGFSRVRETRFLLLDGELRHFSVSDVVKMKLFLQLLFIADVFIRNLPRPLKYSKSSTRKYQVENLIKCVVKYFSNDV